MTHNLYVVDAEGRRSMDARSRELLDKDSREIQTILVMGGITFFITIVMFLSKMDMSADNVMNYAPIIWLVGVMIFGAIINFVNYYKSKKRQKELDRMTLESLLVNMSLPESFPCLLPGPHDECCGGRGIPQRPLPTYDEVLVLDETQQKQSSTSPDNVSLTAPPDYSTALSMLHKTPPAPRANE
ncbi:hypothetical protein GCK72_013462 [Caenorhabditis remanei]|uniref:Uncharacterized protein n=1 Tax=Caenorhabditis remanei TaxID=31234 RepID=A0A6A5GPB0_CAERE|nr:hypothetical protein GCK72_013462 [Caenorhabditis remanei]KAF1757007.1 hypothetical protein GCK72_013462 [Caenorhabditis remanei]